MSNQSTSIVVSSALAFAMGIAALPGSAHAGFFDQLFGGGQPSAPVSPAYGYDQPPQYYREMPADPQRQPRRKPVVDSKPKLQKPTDLMHDATLQNGDAVMMKDGFHIYTGDDSDKQHGKGDFTALDNVDGISKQQKNALVAMDATRNDPLKSGTAPDTVASGRSASVSTPVVAGRQVVDARGKTVRYVGP